MFQVILNWNKDWNYIIQLVKVFHSRKFRLFFLVGFMLRLF